MIPKEYAVVADVPTAINPAVTAEVIPLPARIALLRHAATLGSDPSSLSELSVALAEAGEMVEAARVFRRAYLLQPDIACRALIAFEAANIAKYCDFARFLIAQRAAFAPVIATLAITEGRLGNTAVVQKLIDYDSLFRSYVMEPPAGYYAASICRALAQEIKSDLKFYDRPSDRAIRQAWRHDVGASRLPASKAWVRAVRREIDRYIANLPQLRDHPFLASRPQGHVLAAWAVVSGGASHHLPHIHPRAWMRRRLLRGPTTGLARCCEPARLARGRTARGTLRRIRGALLGGANDRARARPPGADAWIFFPCDTSHGRR